MSSLELLLGLVLVATSGLMASSEVALFSLSRFQIRGFKDRMPRAHKRIKELLSDPGGILITVLVVNEAVNVALSTLISKVVAHKYADYSWKEQALIGTAVTTPILLILCEVIPKVIGARGNTLIAPAFCFPLSGIYRLLTPVRILLNQLISLASRLFSSASPVHTSSDKTLLREQDFLFMVEEGQKEGTVHKSEAELIKNVFEMDDTTAEDILVPMSKVFALSSDLSLKAAALQLKGKRYSRVPVTEKARTKVTGTLHAKDLIHALHSGESLDEPISILVRKPVVVQPNMKVNALFRKLKQQRTHLCIVENKSGHAIGIVTMNDVINELFEEVTKKKK